MKPRNFTHRNLLFVDSANLVALKNGRYLLPPQVELLKRDVIYKENYALECRIRKTETGHINGIPECREFIVGVDALPEGDDIIIVSRQYAEACREYCMPTNRLRVIVGPVYAAGSSQPIACTGLSEVSHCLYEDMPEVFAIDNPNIITQKRIASL